MRAPLILAAAAVLSGCTKPAPPPSAAEAEIARVLDDWHDAAAHADEERYFGHFARGAVFLGTDATERWDVDAFRKYAHPYFAKGKAWSFRSTRRGTTVAPGSSIAWFDEDLATEKLGPCRGSGVVVRDATAGTWRIAQYNLTVTIPNERFTEVRKVLESPAPPASAP